MAGRLTQRAALAGLLLAGCAPLRQDPLPEPRGEPVRSPFRLRVVIFEMAGPDMPLHTGLIIYTPEETLLFDPASQWHPEGQRRGSAEVVRYLTPSQEEDYLARSGINYSLGGWALHLFDREVPPEVARLAHQRALMRPRTLPLHCAHEVSTLLAGLPGHEAIKPRRLTAEFLEQLLARDDYTYSRMTTRGSPRRLQTGAVR